MALTYDSRGNPILSYGAQDASVAWLADRLNWWGFGPSMSDIYDWQTAEAVARMQRMYGLNPDGVMNEDTWGLVDNLIRGIDPRAVSDEQVTPNPGGDWRAAPGGTSGNDYSNGGMLNSAGRDALARLQTILNDYGLGGLSEWVKSKLIAGSSAAEIELELYDQEAFKARFPVIAQRRAAGLTPLNPAQVLEYEQSARSLFRRAGITNPAMMESNYIQNILGNEVSLAELNDRVNDGLMRVTAAPAEVRVAFGDYFGVQGDSALAQFFLDPDLAAPELEKMATTAVAGGAAARFGMQLAQGIAREIADTGRSDAAIWEGFAQLDSIKSLFQESISERQDLTAEGEGVGAVFGTQAGAESVLQRRALSRRNVFAGGGGAASTQTGVIGLGVADS